MRARRICSRSHSRRRVGPRCMRRRAWACPGACLAHRACRCTLATVRTSWLPTLWIRLAACRRDTCRLTLATWLLKASSSSMPCPARRAQRQGCHQGQAERWEVAWKVTAAWGLQRATPSPDWCRGCAVPCRQPFPRLPACPARSSRNNPAGFGSNSSPRVRSCGARISSRPPPSNLCPLMVALAALAWRLQIQHLAALAGVSCLRRRSMAVTLLHDVLVVENDYRYVAVGARASNVCQCHVVGCRCPHSKLAGLCWSSTGYFNKGAVIISAVSTDVRIVLHCTYTYIHITPTALSDIK